MIRALVQLVCTFGFVLVFADQQSVPVLVLHSYHKAAWTDSLLAGMQPIIDSVPDAEFWIEYMDTKRLASRGYFDTLEALYASKYAKDQPHLILITDNNALSFLQARRARLFPDVPIVFGGINQFHSSMLDSLPNATGVAEHGDFAQNLLAAQKLRPSAQHLIVITDSTSTSEANLKELLQTLDSLVDNQTLHPMTWETTADLSLSQLQNRLAQAKPHEIGFFISFWRDSQGKHISPYRLGPLFTGSKIPIFGRSDWMFGFGMVGGRCVTGRTQGSAMAKMALQILQGQPASSIPLLLDSPNEWIFDQRELDRHAISSKLLPLESRILNKATPFYTVGKQWAWTALIALALAILASTMLVIALVLHKGSARQIAAEKERLRAILASIGDGVIATDSNGRVLFLNPVAASLTGWDANEALQRPLVEIFELTAHSKQPELISRNGRRIPVSVVQSPIPTDEKQPVAMVTAFRDITENVRINEHLKQMQKMDAIGKLSGGIVHDLNNMISSIVGSASLITLTLGEGSMVQDHIDSILNASRNAADLNRKLLTLARKGDSSMRSLWLGPLLRDVQGLIKPNLGTVQFALQIQDDVCISGDPSLLQNALLNIVLNARDAMLDTGSITLKLQRVRNVTGTSALITITDTGLGMDSQVLPHIFEPFFTTKPEGKGTGLGLSVTYATIAEHKGLIEVESKLGEGTTFRITLPEIMPSIHPLHSAH